MSLRIKGLSLNILTNYNIALGRNAGLNLTNGSNNIDIGAPGVAAESATIRMGNPNVQTSTFIAAIYGRTVANGLGVIINSKGQLGTVTSSARFKEATKPMDKSSESSSSL